ncbi:helix-turn-helix domain-containing protein [Halopiger aswanensis]|uniref:hypothetical protein n=1 Tax=Halopiger aswanensis TaxID=148449 RepID=UPI000E76A5F0|nr:hypothetical protein [Halopiger aswanensis]
MTDDAPKLSDQQKRIIELLDEGHTWASAADELDISQSALEEQMARVSDKTERATEEIKEWEETLAWLDAHDQL